MSTALEERKEGDALSFVEKKSSDEILSEVKEIICNRLELDQEVRDKLCRDSTFQDDLSADSLDTVEIIMDVEDSFSIGVPDEDAQNMKTVGDAVAHIYLAVNGRKEGGATPGSSADC